MASTGILPPGQSQDLTLQTAGTIDAMFAGQTLQAVFRTSDGHETAPVPFQVVPPPAVFEVQVVYITVVHPGLRARAILFVTNRGAQPGTTTITGTTMLGGARQGTWTPVSITLAGGSSAYVKMTSAAAIDSMFAGQTLDVVFETDDGHRGTAALRVTQFPSTIDFLIQVISITSPVHIGQFAQATLRVTNMGSGSGQELIWGFTVLDAAQQGTWSGNLGAVGQAVPPGRGNYLLSGDSYEFPMQSSEPIPAQFAGRTLAAVFVTGDDVTIASFQVVA